MSSKQQDDHKHEYMSHQHEEHQLASILKSDEQLISVFIFFYSNMHLKITFKKSI